MNDKANFKSATPKPSKKSANTQATTETHVRFPMINKVTVNGTASIKASSVPPCKAIVRNSFDLEIGRLSK